MREAAIVYKRLAKPDDRLTELKRWIKVMEQSSKIDWPYLDDLNDMYKKASNV